MIFSIFKSAFFPQTLDERRSQYSGSLKVIRSGRDLYVSTGFLTQSGGLIKDLWQPVLKQIGQPQKTWLVLGLATGTVAKLISQSLSPKSITGVEIDPVMLDLGKQYFNLSTLPHLKIINADAKDYMLHAAGHFDFILVDLYLGDQLPQFVYSDAFIRHIKQHLAPAGTAVFNHLFYDDAKKAKAKLLNDKLNRVFGHIYFMRKLTNLLLICSQKRV